MIPHECVPDQSGVMICEICGVQMGRSDLKAARS